MNFKIIGALLIVLSCGGFGFLVALHNKKEITLLRELDLILEYMIHELQYRQLPLPELCLRASEQSAGIISKFFQQLAKELSSQILPDVNQCVFAALHKLPIMPSCVSELISVLGINLGKFDLEGQVSGLQWVQSECKRKYEKIAEDQEVKRRSYRTLGLCAGAAIAILFI